MEFLELGVRSDWQRVRWQRKLQRTRRWRLVKTLLLLASFAQVLWILWGEHDGFAWSLPQLFLGPFVLGCIVCWYLLRTRKKTFRNLLIAGIILIAESLFVYLTQSTLATGLVDGGGRSIMSFAILLLPLINAMVLLNFPSQERQLLRNLGLHFEGWGINLLIGFAVGGTLGFHLLLTMGPPVDLRPLSDVLLLRALWTFAFQLGLYGLSEELLFRGMVYVLCIEENTEKFCWAVLSSVFLNTVIHLGFVAQHAPTFGVGLGWLGYQMVLALINLFLFQQRRSLLPCLTVNVVFSLFIVLAWP